MSTIASPVERAVGAGSPRVSGPVSGVASAGVALVRKVRVEDWVTAGLLAAMFIAVGWAVQLSGWGDLPSLLPTLLIAGAAGLWAARTRLSPFIVHPLALAAGFAIVMWQGSIPADGANVADRARDAWDRMFRWVEVAQAGGISTDSVPFAVVMVATAWVVAYLVAWMTFKFRNPWLPVLLLGVGLLTDLSYRQGKHEQTFFIFILGAMALFTHLTAVRRMAAWRKAGIQFPSEIRWMAVRDGVILGGIVVLIAAVLPLVELRSSTLNEQWRVLRRPLDGLREPATRLLSGVRGKEKRPPLAAPGDVLAFQGPIKLEDDPVMWVTSRYPTLHPARIYQYYSSQGWLVGPRAVASVPARAPSGVLPPEKARERIEQRIQPLFNTTTVLPVGAVSSVDRDAAVEILEPPRYVVPLTGPLQAAGELPRDVRQLAADVRLAYRDRPTEPQGFTEAIARIEAALARSAPDDLESTVLVHPESGAPTSVVLERSAPIEQVSVRLDEDITPQEIYTVTTFVSLANDDDLQLAGDQYPGWVTDRYLQLPAALPQRVRNLATEIVTRAGADTPFEKSLAVAAFLRSQVYSQEIAGPEPQIDGVDYFLFETRAEPCPSTLPQCELGGIKGYSQYYGSAATVLLRAVGVPARMVAGWAPGEYVPTAGSFVVRDRDRHGWTQVYFPGYGWIDVEVTPGRSLDPRGEAVPTSPESDLSRLVGGQSFDEDLSQLDTEETDAAARRALEGLGFGTLDQGFNFRVPVPVYYALAALGGLILLSYAGWTVAHASIDPAARPYTKMVRAGWVLGMRRTKDQTPREYAATLGSLAPRTADHALLIARVFERRTYAPGAPQSSEAAETSKAWGKVSRGLVRYRISRLAGWPGARRKTESR